jgi:hypothetical protein
MKTCRKCGNSFPPTTEYFYRHAASPSGLTPRCKRCVGEDNKIQDNKRRERDPEKFRRMATARSIRHYWKDPERSRAKHREAARKILKDPERRAVIYMRKRGGCSGFSPEDFAKQLASQGGKCAICGTTEPEGKVGAAGWNIDHCHVSGRVRFILCGPCNRGLANFRDNPGVLRKAAEVLEATMGMAGMTRADDFEVPTEQPYEGRYQDQAAGPQGAR